MNRFTSTKLLVVFGGFLVALAFSPTILSVTSLRAQDDLDQPGLSTDLIVAVPDPGPQSPQEAYLELVKQKLKLMTPEQLNEATLQLRREFTELQANQKLRETQAQLRNIIQEYPNSSAAVWAKQMLDAGAPRDRIPLFPAVDSPFTPVPNPNGGLDPNRINSTRDTREEYVPARTLRRGN